MNRTAYLFLMKYPDGHAYLTILSDQYPTTMAGVQTVCMHTLTATDWEEAEAKMQKWWDETLSMSIISERIDTKGKKRLKTLWTAEPVKLKGPRKKVNAKVS